MTRKIVYIDMDDTLFDFSAPWNKSKEKAPHIEYPQSQVGFFKQLEPLRGAINAVHRFEMSGEYEVWFATCPSIKNRHCYTEKAESILLHFGEEWLKRLIIIPDKSKLIGDYLIDDRDSGHGNQNKFQGELIQIGKPPFENWQKITDYFFKREKTPLEKVREHADNLGWEWKK